MCFTTKKLKWLFVNISCNAEQLLSYKTLTVPLSHTKIPYMEQILITQRFNWIWLVLDNIKELFLHGWLLSFFFSFSHKSCFRTVDCFLFSWLSEVSHDQGTSHAETKRQHLCTQFALPQIGSLEIVPFGNIFDRSIYNCAFSVIPKYCCAVQLTVISTNL